MVSCGAQAAFGIVCKAPVSARLRWVMRCSWLAIADVALALTVRVRSQSAGKEELPSCNENVGPGR